MNERLNMQLQDEKIEDPKQRFPAALAEISEDISAWSWRTFKKNKSKVDNRLTLGALAPLLSMMDLMGQLEESHVQEDQAKIIGLLVISACDFLNREDLAISHIGNPIPSLGHNGMQALGRAARATLELHTDKTMQGKKRGNQPTHKYRVDILRAMHDLISYLDWYATARLGLDLIQLVKSVWEDLTNKKGGCST